jgi:GT2 family glycosyltransferase
MLTYVQPSYWLKDEPIQNFGDFLSEYFLRNLFLPASLDCDGLWIIGSCIHDYHVELTLSGKLGVVIFWGCGLRDEAGLGVEARKASRFLSVRGPLTRAILKLGDSIPIGDPGLLMPALYNPKAKPELSSISLLVPHFNDVRSDDELKLLTGCDQILRPNLENNLESINDFIDHLVSADFVLCGSLHAAIVAAAYSRPFGFWDSGEIDIPFKWQDFSASISIPCFFSTDLQKAKLFYKKSIKNQIVIPILWPLLATAPYAVRSEVWGKVWALDYSRHGKSATSQTLPPAISQEISLNIDKVVKANDSLIEFQTQQVNSLHHSLEERDSQIQARDLQVSTLNQAVTERDTQISSLHHSLEERDSQIQARDLQVSTLNQAVTERDTQISSLHHSLEERESELAKINFILRRIKSPLRLFNRGISCLLNPIRALKEIRDYRAIKSSGQFDIEYYLNENPDVRIATCNPIRHYCQFGWREGRNPSIKFNTSSYLNSRLDVQDGGINPFSHFLRVGCNEGLMVGFTGEKFAEDFSKGKTENEGGNYLRMGLISKLAIAGFLLPVGIIFYFSKKEFFHRLGEGRYFYLRLLNNPVDVISTLSSHSKIFSFILLCCYVFSQKVYEKRSVLLTLRALKRSYLTERGFRSILRKHPIWSLVRLKNPNSPKILRNLGKKILVVDYRVPMPDISAGERATVGILEDLVLLGYETYFIPNNMLASPSYEEVLRSFGVEVINDSSGYFSPTQFISESGIDFCAFYLIRVDVAEAVVQAIRQVSPNSKVIFHEPDLYFLREAREAELKGEPHLQLRASQTMQRELAMINRVDHTVIVSPSELPVLRQYEPFAPVSVFPVLYTPISLEEKKFSKRKNIFFLGGFGHPPNTDAVIWFVENVFPLIRIQLPDVEFHIVGSEMPQEVLDLGRTPGIFIRGFVPDLEEILAEMRLGVAPLRYGAGIKGKVAMTMGAGVPCICTKIAAEGMGLIDGVNTYIRDEPEEFANAVISLYCDKKTWDHFSVNGKSWIENNFSANANRLDLVRVLNSSRALPLDIYIAYCQNESLWRPSYKNQEKDVEVSIIIPVFNNWGLTRACLNSVIEECVKSKISTEIILADDFSCDETVRALDYFQGIKVIRNKKNLGFLRNCNNSVAHAKGEYILLLNNDTLVLPGWLENLFESAKKDTQAVIVGSKFIYPDGSIQEAGGGLLSSGSGVSLGRWTYQNGNNYPVFRDEAFFNHPREVDYISGASILINKNFWVEVGGFDERYKHGYFEDSDLAMAARNMGYKVIFEPKSEVIHFESKTYGVGDNPLRERLVELNKIIFLNKWDKNLKAHHLNTAPYNYHMVMANAERSIPLDALKRRLSKKLNILYFSPFPSHPSCHGNQSTIYQFGKFMQSLGHTLHFALLKGDMYTSSDIEEMRGEWDGLHIVPNAHPLGANGQKIAFDGWYEEGIGEHVRELCIKHEIDIIICSYIFQSKLLEFIPSYILKVIDTHDKMSDRYEMLLSNNLPLEFFSCSKAEEADYLRRADIVIARRQEEADFFNSITMRDNAIVVSHFNVDRPKEKSFKNLKNIGIVASANNINLAMVSEFIEEFNNQFKLDELGIQVHIAGRVSDLFQQLPKGELKKYTTQKVKFHGFILDIEKFYSQMDLIVSPVTMGTGINVKTVEAMAFSMPLISTRLGIKGIETDEPLHNHSTLKDLVGSLNFLFNNPENLNRLRDISIERYKSFSKTSKDNFINIFKHEKLFESRGPRVENYLIDFAAEFTVEDWGPRRTQKNININLQDDGTSAIWCKCTNVKIHEDLFFRFGDHISKKIGISKDLVTSSVPAAVINNSGEYDIHISNGKNISIFVGKFIVT